LDKIMAPGSMYIWGGLLTVCLLLAAVVVWGLWSGPAYSSETHSFFSDSFLQRAGQFQNIKTGLGLLRQVLTWGILLAVGYFAYHNLLIVSRLSLLNVILLLLVFFLLLRLVFFPVDYFSGFVLEHRYGLTSQPFFSWMADYLKSIAVSVVLSGIVFTVFYYLTVYFTRHWWWIAGILFAVFMVVSAYIYPLVISPMFYRFEPLQEEGLKKEIKSMADRAGINVEEVLVADASRRTHRANAYFAGMGGSRRIVLYDNLVENFSKEEILTVVAHEMGHWKYSHMVKGVVLGAVAVVPVLFVLYRLIGAMGLAGDLRLLPWALLFFSLVSFLAMPVQNCISREWERQADREALHLTGKPGAMVELKTNLAEANLAQVEPHPVIRAVYYSHPPIIERIQMARSKEGQ